MDSKVYYAFTQGRATHGSYANLFTSEMRPAARWNPLWWTLGQIVRYTQLTPLTVFWAAKAILGIGLVMMVYRLAAVFFQTMRWRFIALGLAVFGSGFGWVARLALHQHPGLIWLYQRTDLISVLPTDLTYSSGYLWMSILHSPLYVLSQMLMMFIWWTILQTGRNRWTIQAGGVATLLLGLTHPYDLVLVFGVILAGLIVGIITGELDQVAVKKILRRTVVLLAWAMPAILYYALLILLVPVIRAWNANNVLMTTNLRTVITGYGAGIFLWSLAFATGGKQITIWCGFQLPGWGVH